MKGRWRFCFQLFFLGPTPKTDRFYNATRVVVGWLHASSLSGWSAGNGDWTPSNNLVHSSLKGPPPGSFQLPYLSLRQVLEDSSEAMPPLNHPFKGIAGSLLPISPCSGRRFSCTSPTVRSNFLHTPAGRFASVPSLSRGHGLCLQHREHGHAPR